MTEIFIKPAPGRAVRDPVTKQLLSADGESKPRTPFWARRLMAADVLLATPTPQKKTKAPQPLPASEALRGNTEDEA
ncbi:MULTISPECIES: DUF2635 domain-containing protein [Serratia]|uniref:DUF2635 domain-containing protein n=1 Tax=Serratia TaxID=613 RepID=UPI00065FEAC7|nr:DUF2635 domain-containing protein [Serratia sp. 506_PEND]